VPPKGLIEHVVNVTPTVTSRFTLFDQSPHRHAERDESVAHSDSRMIRQDGDNVPTQTPGPFAAPTVGQPAAGPPDRFRDRARYRSHDESRAEARLADGPAWWANARELPLPWEARAAVRLRRPGFRLPAPDDPAPRTGRMLGVCAWAALLAVIGLAVAARALVALFAGHAPDWYEPTILLVGVTGITLTAAALLAVHHPWLPWIFLAGATVPLVANLAATATAL
jgi:hypothetical protein